MKRFKWTALIAVALVAAMFLSACEISHVYSYLTITSVEGAGTSEIVVSVRKPGTIQDDGAVCDNDLFLPNGIEGLFEGIKNATNLPDAEFTLDDPGGEVWFITISFSFDNIHEYNEKMKNLVDDIFIVDATLEVDGDNVIFRENSLNFLGLITSYRNIIYRDPTAYDRKGGDPDLPDADEFSVEFIAEPRERFFTIGTERLEVDFKYDPQNVEIIASIAGFDNMGAAADEAPVVEAPAAEIAASNPRTGEPAAILIFAALLLASSICLAMLYNKKRLAQKN